MKTGGELIMIERKRQIEEEGWDAEHDDHQQGTLATAGACYALDVASRISNYHESWKYAYEKEAKHLWPWDKEWWKPTPSNDVRELVKAGALIAAEIDRLQRLIPLGV